ncbi:LysR family transcriptional regulator [Methylovirgula sp. 4M-Z18]|uniref:LysR family transcriptional regulator n=1 Tax=Methylovirgula sp. 4M-Z18 TaxID=2293567 RepID=UPI000E2F7C40|nr:LysR family transcriptional regulator [Methylovirgula sp. 4M-Z18]RFB78594.1 LysR family transcriptional regulator [Methylovirgula sp. 4M-Z18]
MTDLNDIGLFVQVVRWGSFSEAGRQLGIPANTVSRRIQDLEMRLGARLMQRSTRKLTLTDAGRSFHARCAAAVDNLEQASMDLMAGSQVPSGLLRVAASASFFDVYKMHWIAEFQAKYPLIKLEFLLEDAFADLIAQRIDVALRGGQARDADYVARRVLAAPAIFVASPDYLAKHGTPRALADLAQHDCLVVEQSHGATTWRVQGLNGEETIEVMGRFAANTIQVLGKAALAGLGIALLPGMFVASDLAAGHLMRVLPQYSRVDLAMNVVYPTNRQVSRAVQVFVDSVVANVEREVARLMAPAD